MAKNDNLISIKVKLKLIFLGTGTSQGIPVIGFKDPVSLSRDPKDKRTRPSIILQIDDISILIDCGPDFRTQMLREKLDRVDAILCTHEHADHTAGLDDLRPINFLHKINIPLFSSRRTIDDLRVRFSYIFNDKAKNYPGIPLLNLVEIDPNKSFQISNISILPIRVLHGKLPILGFRIQNIAYLTDVKTIEEKEFLKLKNLDVLILNALRKKEPHHSHLLLSEAVEIAKRVGAKKTYFTHISHLMGFHEKTNKELPNNIYLAYDGLKLEVLPR